MKVLVHSHFTPQNELWDQSGSLEESDQDHQMGIIERMRARVYLQSECHKLITMGVLPAIKWLSSDFGRFLESRNIVCKLHLHLMYKAKVLTITRQAESGCFSGSLKASDFVQDMVSSVFDKQLSVTYCEVSSLIKNKTTLQEVSRNYQVSCESMIEILQYTSFNEWVGKKTFKVSVESNSVVRQVFNSLMEYFQPDLKSRSTKEEKATLWYSKGVYDDLLVPFWKKNIPSIASL